MSSDKEQEYYYGNDLIAMGEIYKQQGQYAQAIIYLYKAAELIPTRLNNKFRVSNRLVIIGLDEMAASYFINTPFEVFQYWFKNNMELYTSQT